jgi:hypothetical protein
MFITMNESCCRSMVVMPRDTWRQPRRKVNLWHLEILNITIYEIFFLSF